MRPARRGEGGFGLVAALFILVVLAVAATAMVDLGGVQRRSALMSLQSVRVRAAAHTGVQWGLRTALDAGACPATTTLTLTTGGLNGFRVRVTCSSSQHAEGTSTTTVFHIEGEAEYGSFGSLDYVRHRIRASAHLTS